MEQNNHEMYIDESKLHKNRPQPSRKRVRRKSVRALLFVFCGLVVALIGCGVYLYVDMSQIWGGLGDENTIALEEPGGDDVAGLPEVSFEGGNAPRIANTDNTTDILLIGVDNRDSGKFSGRSDVMMYLRVNPEKGTIKLASFMRDMLVEIDGHGKNKLNAAYGFGSIELAKRTYHQSFGLVPDNYMVVNFYGMEDILNALGGVEIDVQKDELEWLNICIDEVNGEEPGGKVSNIRKAGTQLLNGRQAVAYMRVRHPGGDAARIQRQQNVLSALFTEMKNVSVGEIPGLISAMAKYVRTDMPLGAMIDLATAVRRMSGSSLQMFRYPQDYKNGNYKGAAIVQPTDFDKEFGKLSEFLEN